MRWSVIFPATACATAIAAAAAGDPVSWPFDVATEGEDVHWMSPSAVANDAPRYELAYEISTLEVTVRFLIFQFTLDETDQVPPEFRSGSGIVDGPPPIVLFSGHLAFPPPPEDPGFAADVDMRLDGEGFGRLSLTSVVLGEIVVDVPGFGMQTVQLEAVRIAGHIDVTPLGPAADVNGDGIVDFGDLLAVLAAWGACPEPPDPCPADVDGDGVVGFSDLLEVLAHWGES